VCVDDVRLPILDQLVLVFSLHEDHIPNIHVGAYKTLHHTRKGGDTIIG
jgi:hypothetical protein